MIVKKIEIKWAHDGFAQNKATHFFGLLYSFFKAGTGFSNFEHWAMRVETLPGMESLILLLRRKLTLELQWEFLVQMYPSKQPI